MFYKTAVCVAALSALSTVASAQQFGGELGLSYALPTDSSDRSIAEYYGALEYNFGRRFSVGVDLVGYGFEDDSSSFISSTLHLTYHLNASSSVGLFTGRDTITPEGSSTSAVAKLNGIEGGFAYDQFEVEGYIGRTSGGSKQATFYGIDGLYNFNDQIAAVAELDLVNGGGQDYTKIGVGGVYEFQGGPELYGNLGRRSSDTTGAEGSSTFIELGARIKFGTNRGTTFNSRSLFDSVPNF